MLSLAFCLIGLYLYIMLFEFCFSKFVLCVCSCLFACLFNSVLRREGKRMRAWSWSDEELGRIWEEFGEKKRMIRIYCIKKTLNFNQ